MESTLRTLNSAPALGAQKPRPESQALIDASASDHRHANSPQIRRCVN